MASTFLGLFSGPARYVPETSWRPLPALLATFLICMVPILAVFGAMAVMSASAGGGAGDSQVAEIMSRLSTLATFEGAAVAASTQILSLSLVWLFAAWGGNRPGTLKLTASQATGMLYLGAGLLLVALTGTLEFVLYQLVPFDIFADTGWVRDGLNSPFWWMTVVIAVVLAPLWEELTFRGFLLSALSRTAIGFWPAAVISNVIWTLLHASYSIPGLISVFTAGLVMAWLVWRTNSIWPAIAAHAIGNLAALWFAYTFAPVPVPVPG